MLKDSNWSYDSITRILHWVTASQFRTSDAHRNVL